MQILSASIITSLCLAGAMAQSPLTKSQPPGWLEARWRTRIAQDLQRKGIVRSRSDPTLTDLRPAFYRLKSFLPEGKLIVGQPKADKAGSPITYVELQVETTLDETPRTRFIRPLNIIIEKSKDASEAQDRMAQHLQTQAVYEAGPTQGVEPGQLCYHISDGFGASEIFTRANVLVAIHCMVPTARRKIPFKPGDDPTSGIGERTNISALCPSLVSDLGVHIDQFLLEGLGRHRA
jgi:hypothetical protein